MKCFKSVAIGLMMVALGVSARAQSAENLNLNRVVQPPYNSYGRLADGCPNAERLGFKVGIQGYTFNKYTFFEAIDLTRALGLHYIEASAGTRLSPDGNQRINAGMSQEMKDQLKRKLAKTLSSLPRRWDGPLSRIQRGLRMAESRYRSMRIS